MEEVPSAPRFVVGLGNPDRRYQGTRHNVGFMVIEELRRRWDLGRGRRRFHGRQWSGRIAGREVTLLAPQTYMNRSGQAVAEMMAFYKAPPEGVLIVMDDMDLPRGRLRARAGGSAGGHKGLADVLASAGTARVPRLRVGIGAAPPGTDPVEYVLGRFSDEELPAVRRAVARAADAVEDWAAKGITYVMDHYNQDASQSVNVQDESQP